MHDGGKRDEANWRDTGCEVAPACLECPLPQCRYDVRGGLRTMRNAQRDPAVAAMWAQGATIDELTEQYALSRRSVYRLVQARTR